MTAQFDAAEALLKEIQAETAAVRVAVEEQNEKVLKVTEDVESAVRDMRDSEARTRDEMREIREEVNTVREMLPKVRTQLAWSLSRYLPLVQLAVDRQEQGEPEPVVSGIATRAEVAQGAFAQSRTWHSGRTFDACSSREAFNTRLAISWWVKYVKCFYPIFFPSGNSCAGPYKCATRWQREGGFFSRRCFAMSSYLGCTTLQLLYTIHVGVELLTEFYASPQVQCDGFSSKGA